MNANRNDTVLKANDDVVTVDALSTQSLSGLGDSGWEQSELVLVQRIYRKYFARFAWGEKLKLVILPTYLKLFGRAKKLSRQAKTFRMVWCAENLSTPDFIKYRRAKYEEADKSSCLKSPTNAPNTESTNRILIVDNCTVIGGTRFVLRNGMASLDIAKSPIDLASSYRNYHLQEEVQGSAKYDVVSGKIRINSPSPFSFLLGNWISTLHSSPENWMHFLSETAPKVQLAVESAADLPFGVLFDEGVSPAGLELLRVLVADHPMLGLPPQTAVHVSRLVIPVENTPAHAAFWTRKGVKGTGFGHFDPRALCAVRAKVFDHYKIVPESKRHIYIKRTSYFRHIINQTEIEEVLTDRGFGVLSPGNKTLEEQVSIFSEASVLVAQAGAALANMMFMPKGAKVICLTADSEWVNYDYFEDYAKVFDLDLSYIKGPVLDPENYDETELLSIRHPLNSEFECPIAELLSTLERVES